MPALNTKTEDLTPSSDDILYAINDPAGTPADRKVKAGNLVTKAHGLADGYVKVATGVMTVESAATVKTALALVKGDVGLGSVDNTSDAAKPVSTAQQTALDAKADLVGGLVPTAQLPAVSLTNVQTAASEVAMLALTTQEGDVVVRTDENKTYMRNAGATGTMTDFTLLNTPADAVTSVNSQTGAVVLGAADVGAMANVTPGTSGNVLTSNGSAWTSATPAGGGGQTLVTHIVAASGGTHTTLGAAVAAAAAGDTIYVREGTYTEGAITSALANITIVGENWESTILAFGANAITMSGAQLLIRNIKMTFTTGKLDYSGNHASLRDVRIEKTGTGNGVVVSSSYASWNGVYYLDNSTDTGTPRVSITAFQPRFVNCMFEFAQGCNVTGNGAMNISSSNGAVFSGCQFSTAGSGSHSMIVTGTRTEITGSAFYGAGATETFIRVGQSPLIVTSCQFISIGTVIDVVSGGNHNIANNVASNIRKFIVFAASQGNNSIINANYMGGNSTLTGNNGITITSAADDVVITGNRATGFDVGVSIGASTCDRTVVVGNSLVGNSTSLSDSGTGTVNSGNSI